MIYTRFGEVINNLRWAEGDDCFTDFSCLGEYADGEKWIGDYIYLKADGGINEITETLGTKPK